MILLEDAMLVHRIVRAPGRRVFYIDVGNVPPEDVANYMEQAQSSLKRSSIIDKQTGKVDLRYNPLSIDEDYFVPVRGGDSGTKIDTLEGTSITGDTSDVEYIQKKLFAALKIPKAYLGYDEGLGAKATLSQEDIRFSRTIARIQRTILSEMNKIAIVHLYCNGFSDEDLLDFKLMLSNPSTIAQQQKLQLINERFDTASKALSTAGLVDRTWVQKNILRLTDEELSGIKKGLKKDKVADLEIESTQITTLDGPESDIGAPGVGNNISMMSDPPSQPGGLSIDLAGALSEENTPNSIEDEEFPIKVQKLIEFNTSEIEDDLKEMNKKDYLKTGVNNSIKSKDIRKRDKLGDLEGQMEREMWELENLGKTKKSDIPSAKDLALEEDFDVNEYLDSQITINAAMTNTIKSTLDRFSGKFGSKSRNVNKSIIISENNSSGENND
jgi:hypothetical protein